MSLIYKIFKLKTKSWIKNWIYNQEKAPTPILPTEYQQVEYIESSGTQYIDTGFTPTLNTKLKLKFNYLLASSTAMVFGCKSESSNYYQLYKGGNDGRLTVSFGIRDANNSKTILTNFVNTDIDIEIDKNKIVLNGGDYGYTATPSINGYNSLGLFARHNPSDWTLNSSIKMYYFKIYDNGILVRNFVPCYKKADNTIGLYDVVNDVFYTNLGTGEFGKGGDV